MSDGQHYNMKVHLESKYALRSVMKGNNAVRHIHQPLSVGLLFSNILSL